MRRILRVCALAGALLSATAALAEDGEGYYRIHAAGTVICNGWSEARAGGGSAGRQLEWWVAGYMTAYNRFILTKARVTPDWNTAAYYGWLDAYCAERPGDRLATAMERLIYRLGVRPAEWPKRGADAAG